MSQISRAYFLKGDSPTEWLREEEERRSSEELEAAEDENEKQEALAMTAHLPTDPGMPEFPNRSKLACECHQLYCTRQCIRERWNREKWALFRQWRSLRFARMRARSENSARKTFISQSFQQSITSHIAAPEKEKEESENCDVTSDTKTSKTKNTNHDLYDSDDDLLAEL